MADAEGAPHPKQAADHRRLQFNRRIPGAATLTMSGRDNRGGQGSSGERSPLRPAGYQTSYGVHCQAPRPPGVDPPPCKPVPAHPNGGYQPHQVHQPREGLSLPSFKTRTGTFTIFLIVLAQVLAFIFFYDLPTKLGDYSRATALMREQEYAMGKEATHLESERVALRGESDRLEKERLALESTMVEMEGEKAALESAIHHSQEERLRFTQEKQLLEDERVALQGESNRLEKERLSLESTILELKEERAALESAIRHLEQERLRFEQEKEGWKKERLALESTILEMEGKRAALESAIHHSEQERLRFAQEKQLLEDERHLLEQEKEESKKERKRWERAREDRVPQGAFWDPLWPAWDCRAYGKREYWAELQNIPEDWTDMEACMNMPVEIKGVSVRRPNRCGYVEGSSRIHGFWMVDWDQVDCKPWHVDATDQGCTNTGSGTRHIEARIMGINDKPGQDWRLLCESTPFTWDHVTYHNPAHCEAGMFGRKYAIWDVPDPSC